MEFDIGSWKGNNQKNGSLCLINLKVLARDPRGLIHRDEAAGVSGVTKILTLKKLTPMSAVRHEERECRVKDSRMQDRWQEIPHRNNPPRAIGRRQRCQIHQVGEISLFGTTGYIQRNGMLVRTKDRTLQTRELATSARKRRSTTCCNDREECREDNSDNIPGHPLYSFDRALVQLRRFVSQISSDSNS